MQILTVCTHNRTRSVMSMAMLQGGFDRRLGVGRVVVGSLGFGPEGLPAIDAAVEAMARRGLDISGHRSRRVTADRIEPADLILASEREHVIKVFAESPDAFRRSFTLPEFCGLVAAAPVAGDRSLAEWAAELSLSRRATDYLGNRVPEVADPTGSSRRRFERATARIEVMCTEIVDRLSPAL